MRNKILTLFRNNVPYIKELRQLSGSVTASILMQQLDYWFEKKPGGFYKFLEPCENNELYKTGDSWTEELGFSKLFGVIVERRKPRLKKHKTLPQVATKRAVRALEKKFEDSGSGSMQTTATQKERK